MKEGNGPSKVARVDDSAKKSPEATDDSHGRIPLTHDQFLAQLQQIMERKASPELAIVHLMLEYSFNPSDLRRVL